MFEMILDRIRFASKRPLDNSELSTQKTLTGAFQWGPFAKKIPKSSVELIEPNQSSFNSGTEI